MCKPSQREDQFSGAAVEHVACSHKGLARSYVHAHFRAVAMSNFTLSIYLYQCAVGRAASWQAAINSIQILVSEVIWSEPPASFSAFVLTDVKQNSWGSKAEMFHFVTLTYLHLAGLQSCSKAGNLVHIQVLKIKGIQNVGQIWNSNVTKVTKVTKSLMFAGRSQTALVSSDSW